MIRCIAIDDEPLALAQITGYIKKTPFLTFVAGCPSCRDTTKILDCEHIDLIFADINMPDMSGMDFVKTLKGKYMVIFTTAYSEYALDGFKVDAIDYILKPFSYKDFLKSANKAIRQYNILNSFVEEKQSDAIYIKNDYKIIKIDKSSITYIEGESEYIRIHTDDGKSILHLSSMKAIIEKLNDSRFIRIHRSYIANTSRIREVSANNVNIFIRDNLTLKSLPIGEQYRDCIRQWCRSKG
jgi:DNA-binding LytR/AlgR family response regulator